MNRTSLINFLLRQRNGKRYLEIGFNGKDDNFDKVICTYKLWIGQTAEDPSCKTADAYFKKHTDKFDLILIDGYHTEKQVMKDYKNALNCLSADGVIVLHDCMPPDEWHQREPEAFNGKENWNGTVWKAALRIFNQSVYKCTLIDMDWGCAVIDTASAQFPLQKDIPKDLEYKTHYPLLLAYKTSPLIYLREQVKVFYHLACMGNWKEVFREQMILLRQHGFQWIDLSVLGTETDIQFAKNCFDELGLKTNVFFHSTDLTNFERPAFIRIQEYAKDQEGYVLYLHSKGVSNPADITKTKWRNLMMQELVVKHDYCKKHLQQYDVIGVNWRDMPPVSHFCGNFWYASTQYLRKLPDFKKYYDNPRYKIWDQVNSKRLGCEFWIGSYHSRPRILSLAYRNVDFCNPVFWKDKKIATVSTLTPVN